MQQINLTVTMAYTIKFHIAVFKMWHSNNSPHASFLVAYNYFGWRDEVELISETFIEVVDEIFVSNLSKPSVLASVPVALSIMFMASMLLRDVST